MWEGLGHQAACGLGAGNRRLQRQTEMFPKRAGCHGAAPGHWYAHRKMQQELYRLYGAAAPLL